MSTPKTINHLLLYIAAAVVFTCSSCKNKSNEKPPDSVDTVSRVKMDEQTNSTTAFRIALANLPVEYRSEVFNCMSSDLKAAVWQDRITGAVNSTSSDPEKKALNSFLPYITPALYDEVGTLNESFSQTLAQAITAFENDTLKLYRIITLLNDDTGVAQVLKNGKPPVCDCSIPSDLCWVRNNNLKCINFNCRIILRGCGWFWAFPCDAMCAQKEEN